MGSNNNGSRERYAKLGTTVITKGTKLTGDIDLDGTFHLDGFLEGNLTGDSRISIGKSGLVQGNITAREVYISGKVEGNIVSESCDIMAGGKVQGKIKCKSLAMQISSVIHGETII